MCDFCRMMPTDTAFLASMPAEGQCSRLYQFMYSSLVSNTLGAKGCQMPLSGISTGSAMAEADTVAPSTKSLASMRSIDSRFWGDPPSQYWKDIMKERASLALSEGRNLSTLGSVRSSLSMPSSNEEPSSFFFFFMKSPMTDLDWPRFCIENEPTLFRRITSGMEGKMSTASRRSLLGASTSTTLSASSCTKMREPMKMLASATSALNCSSTAGLRSSSSR
mmetsp:Transcript_16525/g.36615  ORF Transcript_16525/g.36615 Transcript_16525/m.36615 type:complete len:221 (-) Transcript_16525:435-1097(-)